MTMTPSPNNKIQAVIKDLVKVDKSLIMNEMMQRGINFLPRRPLGLREARLVRLKKDREKLEKLRDELLKKVKTLQKSLTPKKDAKKS